MAERIIFQCKASHFGLVIGSQDTFLTEITTRSVRQTIVHTYNIIMIEYLPTHQKCKQDLVMMHGLPCAGFGTIRLVPLPVATIHGNKIDHALMLKI